MRKILIVEDEENMVLFIQMELKYEGYNVDVASDGRKAVELALKNNEIYDYFDAITITDEVSIGKHEPDVYLLAAQKLNVNPKNCIVFEDIVQAVKGAKKANMKVIAVEDERSLPEKEELTSLSDKFISDFLELIPSKDIAI